jgi:hypothetical protein
MATAARADALARFSFSGFAERLETIYGELTATR